LSPGWNRRPYKKAALGFYFRLGQLSANGRKTDRRARKTQAGRFKTRVSHDKRISIGGVSNREKKNFRAVFLPVVLDCPPSN